MKVKVYHNGDDVLVAWKPAGFIADCRGFALWRRRNGSEEIVSTWVGFKGQDHAPGERRTSINWPIQKYQWTDYMASPGDRVQYRVVPMVGPNQFSLQQDQSQASDWTPELHLTPEVTPHMQVYFNRGIVASQWVSRRLGVTVGNIKFKRQTLKKVIGTPGDPLRNYLSGTQGSALTTLLAEAATNKRHVYAALFELDDPELLAALSRLGKRAHVVLANGAVKKKGEDENEQARAALTGKIDLHDRLCAPKVLGHNKFLVVCDENNTPRWVWTGSLNWTKTGLCTQANNSVLIDDPALAQEYKEQWERLRGAGNDTPDSLKQANSEARQQQVGDSQLSVWFTPTVGEVDLAQAREVIASAEQAILFLMFNPGPKNSLLNVIIDRARADHAGERLYVHGAVNQDPSTAKTKVELFDGRNSIKSDFSVALPAEIDVPTEWFAKEMLKLPETHAMVHSKVIVVDPFGAHPVVMTGSHNLGPKASGVNDENLLIIRDAPGLAAAYVTHIMAVYTQYRWRMRSKKFTPKDKAWSGLVDDDSWQTNYLKEGSRALREINFWVGETSH